ncbi:uncharacterized protein SCHCODRAFT_02638182 [Schizophyllum commune H4-8]|uniref:uncharacterized protein n=1 Tax=Schizophyllum commune (strain H4-8 / FGSC 9210) TaxID=578458 RepID=UPI0021603716|nr:uncharacterized protein SCHCODRAFT_02638182 [Schizophyllum commune H4-8]KAI5887457.1 hypothetical protein SCHCODRAFT_02638182 [Schizophyllum commune H4-8]
MHATSAAIKSKIVAENEPVTHRVTGAYTARSLPRPPEDYRGTRNVYHKGVESSTSTNPPQDVCLPPRRTSATPPHVHIIRQARAHRSKPANRTLFPSGHPT